jgi:TonB family protein
MPDPPRTAPVPKVTAIEPDPLPVATADPIPEPEPILAAQSNAITDSNAFAVLGPTSNTSSLSRGPGIDDGAGGKKGTGNGPENGPGLGPKQGGNDLPLRPGPGLTNPTLISSAKPSYTAEAMLRRIRGVVALECVIARNGSVDSCTVIESLDRVFGLDEEAIKAARQFRFTPGRKDGQPVPVFVRIEIRFNMQ